MLDALVEPLHGDPAASELEPEVHALVRVAALAALDASPAGWQAHIGAPEAAPIRIERVRSVLQAIAPIIGSARLTSSTARAITSLEHRGYELGRRGPALPTP